MIETHFTWIDGGIIGLYLLLTMFAGIRVRKYVGGVEDFLVAGREMNVYLGIASLAATEFGVVTCVYAAQNGYDKGFAGATPGILFAMAMLVVGLTGFCIKPLRESGAITIPELFEKRFGQRIRWLSGVVIVLGGLLNMGIFLRTGGEFLVHVSGLRPDRLELTMTILLIAVAVYTILGGMLSVLVTDYLQFIFMSLGLMVVTVLILKDVGWTAMVQAVETHHGAGGFNPFLNTQMGWPFIIFNGLLNFAAVLTWQTTVARVLAAKDARTGSKIYTRTSFFFVCRFLIPGLWGIAALAVLDPGLLHGNTGNAMPMLLARILPTGVMGLLIAAMLAADMSTDSSYMLTWGGVIYNDILAPFHKGKWSQQRGLMVNRFIIALIGVFLLVFGLWYPLTGSIWDYLTITGSIYLSSMSVLLIACCYWPRANGRGAGAAIVTGALIPLGYLVLEKSPGMGEWVKQSIGPYYSGIGAFVGAALAMIIGSLSKPKDARDEVAPMQVR